METFINPTPLFWALGPAALTRLVAGLADRTVSVRSAAGQAVDAWCQAGKSVLEPNGLFSVYTLLVHMHFVHALFIYDVDVDIIDIIGLVFLVFLQTHSIHWWVC